MSRRRKLHLPDWRKAAPAAASLQTASRQYVYKGYGELAAAMTAKVPDYGDEPHGMAIFTSDGYFMVEVFRDVRVKVSSKDRAKGTPRSIKTRPSAPAAHSAHTASTRQPAKSR